MRYRLLGFGTAKKRKNGQMYDVFDIRLHMKKFGCKDKYNNLINLCICLTKPSTYMKLTKSANLLDKLEIAGQNIF